MLRDTVQTSGQTGPVSIFLHTTALLWLTEKGAEQPAPLANAHDPPAIPWVHVVWWAMGRPTRTMPP